MGSGVGMFFRAADRAGQALHQSFCQNTRLFIQEGPVQPAMLLMEMLCMNCLLAVDLLGLLQTGLLPAQSFHGSCQGHQSFQQFLLLLQLPQEPLLLDARILQPAAFRLHGFQFQHQLFPGPGQTGDGILLPQEYLPIGGILLPQGIKTVIFR